ncbi:DUF643 domain-containing protein [Borreliella japonica]|uniref:DUF643 domain-containing protein n=1 Tax=Borreliella japonica TaxID=34095 RepID=UPI003AF07ED0
MTKIIVQDIVFLLYCYTDNMHANKVSDFYDNLDQKSKKAIPRLYRTDQPTMRQKRRIYKNYKAIQEYIKKNRKKY